MNTARARELLQLLPEETSVRSVKAAFARRCRECHPDTRVTITGRVVPIQELQAARDCLLSSEVTQKSACVKCHGTGKMRGVMGYRSCVVCGGSGDNYGQTITRGRRGRVANNGPRRHGARE